MACKAPRNVLGGDEPFSQGKSISGNRPIGSTHFRMLVSDTWDRTPNTFNIVAAL